MQTESA